MSSYPSTFVAYTGTSPDAPLVGGQDPVSGRVLEVLWAGSTLGMAQQFQDGEIRKLRVHLKNPLVLDEDARREQFGDLGHARIVDQVYRDTILRKAAWDGVIFKDTVDGMEVSNVMAIFPKDDYRKGPTVSHAVTVIGKTSFDYDEDEWVSTPGFSWSKNFEPVNPPWERSEIAANGNPVQDNFNDWFESSCIVNDLGRPQMVFHGTRETFDEFQPGRYQEGYFFSHNPDYAFERAIDDADMPGENAESLMPVYLSMKSPLDIRLGLSSTDKEKLVEAGVTESQLDWIEDKDSEHYMVLFKDVAGDKFVKSLQRAGFDGMIFNEISGGDDPLFAYAVFSPTQIKSAISNSGLYLKDSYSLTDRDASLALKKSAKALSFLSHASPKTLEMRP